MYVYVQIYIQAYTAMKAERNDAATTGRVVVRDCMELWFNVPPGEKLHRFYFILFSVHSSFHLFSWMTSAVFREEPSRRVGPLLVFGLVFFLFVWLVVFFVFLSLFLSASPLSF